MFVIKSNQQPPRRSMQSALRYFGIDEYRPLYHRGDKRHCGYRGFWVRHEDDLDLLAYDVRQAVHKHLLKVRTDLVENHEEAVRTLAVYQWLKKQFAQRGVRL